ncbi:MAG: hypothetical protein QOE61_3412 [Micromonosporaceae bacterium]|nr:hypothetical protein [Micromonosporaceae bacterium]
MPDEPDLGPVFDQFAAGAAMPIPDLAEVRARTRRRQTSRWAIAAAAMTVLAAPVAAHALAGQAPAPGDPQAALPASAIPASAPAASAAATPTASPVRAARATPTAGATPGSIDGTDWANATLEIPANQTGCAAGTAHFHNRVSEVGGTRYRLGSGYLHSQAVEVAYGDVDADGQAEALVIISCANPDGRANPTSLVLLVGASPSIHTMALAFSSSPRISDGEGKSHVTGLSVHADGQISFAVRTFEGNGQCEYVQRWTGTALTGGCNP